MIINFIMEILWENATKEYKNIYAEYADKDLLQIYNEIYKSMHVDIGMSTEVFNENILLSTGCKNRNREKALSGCSMCQWDDEDLAIQAKLKVLKERDSKLYAKLIREGFIKKRGEKAKPSLIEEIASCNVFDNEDFTDNVFDKLFNDNPVFETKPLYGIIAVRANDVTSEKIERWKKQFRGRLFVGFGIEVGCDWLRNHWINKNTTNEDIMKAIGIIREAGCVSSGDILLGIPGLSAYQSLQTFLSTCGWLYEQNIDTILVSPLTSKSRTLQYFITENIDKNETKKINGRKIMFSGIPSAYVFITALYEAIRLFPGIEEIIQLSPQNGFVFLERFMENENKTEFECYFAAEYKKMIEYNISQQGIDKEIINELYSKAAEEEDFKRFIAQCEIEKEISVKDSLLWLCENILLELGLEQSEIITKSAQFKGEMEHW
ncbi:MAG: hypothetical protein FWE14_00160 [Lachnospiraceae bacterium]|nr:hypothetical protein [Lachnospiraceae bacterium]